MLITKVIVILDEMIFKFLSLLSHYATGIIIKSQQKHPKDSTPFSHRPVPSSLPRKLKHEKL